LVPAKTITWNCFGISLDLNPGPFNVKEHSVIVIMASVGLNVANASDIIVTQMVYYKKEFGLLYQVLMMMSTQTLGYGMAGLMRKSLGKSARLPYQEGSFLYFLGMIR
jgi:hypothetical protein